MSSHESASSSSDSEPSKYYKPGGYHPTEEGEKFHDRYKAVNKIGWGRFSTVWRVKDPKRKKYRAIKIIKSKKEYRETGEDEIEILNSLKDKQYPTTVIKLLDSFSHTGPNGKHICMIFPLLGDDLLKLRDHICDQDRYLSINIVKHMCRNILEGLHFIHKKGVIHTDLKLENLMLTCSADNVNDELRFGVVIVDLGTARFDEEENRGSIQTTEYRSPEAILYSPFSTPVDIWSAACVFFEIMTREYLFDPHSSFDSEYSVTTTNSVSGEENENDVKGNVTEESGDKEERKLSNISNGSESNEEFSSESTRDTISNDSNSSTESQEEYEIDYQHLTEMMQLLGELPEKVIKAGKYWEDYFDEDCTLCDQPKIEPISMKETILVNRESIDEKDAEEFAEFLLPLLEYVPGKRATAFEALKLPWLSERVE
jgi:serine/threonine-protein kinase SRPK3